MINKLNHIDPHDIASVLDQVNFEVVTCMLPLSSHNLRITISSEIPPPFESAAYLLSPHPCAHTITRAKTNLFLMLNLVVSKSL